MILNFKLQVMKNEILAEIRNKVNEYDKYFFDFDGERIATDVLNLECETENYVFNLTLQVWIKDSTWYGYELDDTEVMEFMVWDKCGNDIDTDITDKEIIEQIKIF